MSSAHQYDSLGRIMSLGGEIRLGVATALGYGSSRLSGLFTGRLGNVSPEDKTTLLDFADAGAAAGRLINSLGFGDLLPIDDIPINPNLWGENPDGRRLLLVGTFQVTGSDQSYERRIELPDNVTYGELAEWLAGEAYKSTHDSPQKFGMPPDDKGEPITLDILFAERRF